MGRYRKHAFVFTALVILQCNRRAEILPDGAKQVARSDSTENNGSREIKLREYRFSSSGHSFICEARSYANATLAEQAAAKAIAERPAEQRKSARAHFAASGRSVWLQAGNNLTWCMLSSAGKVDLPKAMEPVLLSFKKLYEDAK
ncbi:MAG: hypothetical protein JNJ69_10045 [Leptospiraceae bacterium]|nr:hypothetical protein [Leptospiraceae bacterium]